MSNKEAIARLNRCIDQVQQYLDLRYSTWAMICNSEDIEALRLAVRLLEKYGDEA